MARKWEYLVTRPPPPTPAVSPIMDDRQMAGWLDHMDEKGWEFVSYGSTHWGTEDVPQQWWIFRRPTTT